MSVSQYLEVLELELEVEQVQVQVLEKGLRRRSLLQQVYAASRPYVSEQPPQSRP